MNLRPFRISLLLFHLLTSFLVADDTLTSVQTRLRHLGYYSGAVDGTPGSQTSAAIRRYQLANDLRITGKLNPATMKSLGIPEPATSPAPKPKSARLADLYKDGPLSTANPETQAEILRKAQKILCTLGYYREAMDGDPGPCNDRRHQGLPKGRPFPCQWPAR